MTSEPTTIHLRANLRICPLLIFGIITLSPEARLTAQGSAGSSGKLEPRSIVDFPTAGMIPRGDIAFDVEFYGQGGVDVGMCRGDIRDTKCGKLRTVGLVLVHNPAPRR